MRAWFAEFGGGVDSLRLGELPDVEPANDEVLVGVEAVSLNRRDLNILDGRYPLPVKPTLVPACDGVGTIVEVGSESTHLRVGQRVIGAVFPSWFDGRFSLDRAAQLGGSLDGMLREFACLKSSSVIPIPDHMSVDQAATLPCAGVTAWHALQAIGGHERPQTILTTSSGAVSMYALMFAKAFGHRVIVTTTQPGLVELLEELGADRVVSSTSDLVAATGELAESADAAVHTVGDVNETLTVTAVGGTVACVSPAHAIPIDPVSLFVRNLTIKSISLGTVRHSRETVDFVAKHGLQVPIRERYPFSDVDVAFRRYATETKHGKIVVSVR